MAFPVWLDNLIAYSLQIAILAAAGTLLAYVFRLRVPRISLVYWQALLIACLLLPALQSWRHAVIVPVDAVSGTVSYVASDAFLPSAPSASVSSHPKFGLPSIPESIVLVFVAGFIGRLIWLAIGLFRLRLFLRRSNFVPAKDAGVHGISSQIGARARFFVSDHINSPATFGFLNPAVILPRSFTQLSDACREAVLCHELLHVRRRDWAVILGEEIVRSIFWFHPAVWWLLAKIHLSREQWIDYEVVRLTGNKQPYLESLLEIAEACGRPKAIPAPLFLRERHLVQRVALLLKEASMNRWRLAFSLAIILLLLAGTVRLASAWFPLTGESVISGEQSANQNYALQKPESIKPEIGAQTAAPAKKQVPVTPDPAARKTPKSTFLPVAGAPVLSPVPATNQDNAQPVREPIRVGGGVQESKLLKKVEPIYPELAKRARVQGKVVLMVTVDEQGYVSDARVMEGHPLLNDAAVSAVKKWRYSPTLLNGAPVPVIATVTIVFNLAEAPSTLSFVPPTYVPPPQENPYEYGLPGTVPQFMNIVHQDPLFGAVLIVVSPMVGVSPSERFFPPQFAFDIERLHDLMKAAGWESVQQPTGGFTTGAGSVYSFVLNEAGEISKVQYVKGIQIPGMEDSLARTRIVALGRRGADFIPVSCTIQFLRVPGK
jgi:TonB family protein